MQRPTQEELLALYDSGPEATIAFIEQLLDQIEHFSTTIARHEARIKVLEDRSSKDSRTSHKPPSSDGLAKPPRTRSLREKGKRDVGGQKGHQGQTLKSVAKPDRILIHRVSHCSDCGGSLADVTAGRHESRQVFDIPPVALEVTEHQAEIKTCPSCQARTTAEFPEGVTQPTQYGSGIKAQAIYLMNQHLLPFQRTSDLLADFYQHRISVGTLFNINQTCFESLLSVADEIKDQVLASEVAHFDETSLRINGKNHWLHVAGTKDATFYSVHPKRGTEAMNDAGVLPDYRGVAVHDGLTSYFSYEDCAHALCNAHHLRELNYMIERHEQKWAQQMKSLLLNIKDVVFKFKTAGESSFSKAVLKAIERRFRDILAQGFIQNPEYPCRRKRNKRTEPQRFLRRLKKYQRQTLAFMYDFNVPFDNNLAERDIRMMKLRQKISGGFRTIQGAEMFCRIKAFLATAVKQNKNPLQELQTLML